MTQTYTQNLEHLFRSHANDVNAGPMRAYMKDHFPFLGIKSPERTALLREFVREHGVPEGDMLSAVVRELWALPEREFQYAALELLEKRVKKLDVSFLPLLEELVVHKSWWDTVDTLAARLVGVFLTKHPEMILPSVDKWLASEHMWLQRTAILFQLKYKEKTDLPLLYRSILHVVDSKEFFLQKAIGWALREYAKTDAQAVIEFVGAHPLAPLSRREALKHVAPAT
ncbi:DNA alkylation repair protein [Brevibacillus dissolubilis]|uniref:DNA alkylation repair protein n=1 Tax=Brevibacillus dissolubilis TaxID=1844116 RepID=UPI00111604C7|nr:DNA alkylation repair protein [Brevibacillus dissolubilis]